MLVTVEKPMWKIFVNPLQIFWIFRKIADMENRKSFQNNLFNSF